FPLIEDGDFDIPSVFCTDIVGEQIAANTGEVFRLETQAKRIPATACNVVARKYPDALRKVVITAHIDACGNTPGALDDASGVVVELLLAEMLREYGGPTGIEVIAFNGEDYYSAGGQMDYVNRYGKDFDKIVVAINIDDVGYFRGKSAYSMYGCPNGIQQTTRSVLTIFNGIMAGVPWYQGDHMIFVQKEIPAIAFTSEHFSELMATITHTEKDTPDMVDCSKLTEVASAIHHLIGQY
ncbi:M28 family metallopeptidase, partial [Chloroflexota bacterium]